jgi:hypothetical protein
VKSISAAATRAGESVFRLAPKTPHGAVDFVQIALGPMSKNVTIRMRKYHSGAGALLLLWRVHATW